jgi:hypothetical protein
VTDLDTADTERGWESVHQSAKKGQCGDDERWKLRDWDKHPKDPGWESGSYTCCHSGFRAKAQTGDIVFDTVYPKSWADGSPIIRSAFVVESAEEGELSFSEFLFLDGEAADGVRAQMPRNYKSLDRADVENYLRQMEDSGAYTRYNAGEKPESIGEDMWEKMISEAGRAPACSSTGIC